MRKVWVNGCFDILHEGHIELLRYASQFGDYLFVGIDSDRRVRELKGSERPINSENSRKKVLEAIKYVNSVIIFDTEEELRDIIHNLSIDVMIIGDDYENKTVIGSELVDSVYFFHKIENVSTTNIIEKIRK